MATNLYIASLQPSSGKSVVALGLMEMLSRRLDSVGYFRPVIPSATTSDSRIALVAGRYAVPGEYDEQHAYTADEVTRLLAEGRTDTVFKGILEAYRALERRCEFVLCDGTDYTGTSAALEFDFNAQVANHLGAPVLALVNGSGRPAEEVVSAVRVARESLAAEGCTLAVTVVNRVDPADTDQVRKALDSQLPDHEPIYVLPEEPLLRMPTVGEVAGALDGQDLRGEAADLQREIAAVRVASMSLPNFLDHLVEGALVIAAGDRPDIIVGTVASRLSAGYPNVAALVLTGGLQPEPQILRLLDGFGSNLPPIFSVAADTYTTARKVNGVVPVIRPDSERKIAAALGVFETSVDLAELENRISVTRSDRVTPLMFEYELIERARADRKRIVLPEGTDERILEAAQLLVRRAAVDVVLLGDGDEVAGRAALLGVDLDGVTIVDPAASDLHNDYAAMYHELRSHRGVTEEVARDTMLDVNYFGTMMVHTGAADGMVSGAAHTTASTIRPAFEFIRTKPGVTVVSSVFLMLLADRVLVYGDCAINPDPDAEQLADIAVSSAETAATFGIPARVAMLSYSTGESGSGAAVDKVRRACELARERRPDLVIDGPLQYDAAVDASVAQAKRPDSDVAGQATVFIFPDLNTGNNTYKAVQRSAGAVAIGPVLQGLNKPVNDLSRGCQVSDVVNTVAITAVQAQESD